MHLTFAAWNVLPLAEATVAARATDSHHKYLFSPAKRLGLNAASAVAMLKIASCYSTERHQRERERRERVGVVSWWIREGV